MSLGSNPLKAREWADRFLRFDNAQQSVVEFCRSEGVSQPSFYAWRKKLADKRSKPVGRMRFEPVPFVRPRLESGLMVRLPGGVELELASDLELVQAVVKQLIESSLPEAGRPAC